MASKCLVAEDTAATKSELDEISQIMAGVSLQSEDEDGDDKPAPKTPPPEAPAVVILEKEKKPVEEEAGAALDKTLLGEADPYFKTSSDDESTTYI
jgi:hypothetical protein